MTIFGRTKNDHFTYKVKDTRRFMKGWVGEGKWGRKRRRGEGGRVRRLCSGSKRKKNVHESISLGLTLVGSNSPFCLYRILNPGDTWA